MEYKVDSIFKSAALSLSPSLRLKPDNSLRLPLPSHSGHRRLPPPSHIKSNKTPSASISISSAFLLYPSLTLPLSPPLSSLSVNPPPPPNTATTTAIVLLSSSQKGLHRHRLLLPSPTTPSLPHSPHTLAPPTITTTSTVSLSLSLTANSTTTASLSKTPPPFSLPLVPSHKHPVTPYFPLSENTVAPPFPYPLFHPQQTATVILFHLPPELLCLPYSLSLSYSLPVVPPFPLSNPLQYREGYKRRPPSLLQAKERNKKNAQSTALLDLEELFCPHLRYKGDLCCFFYLLCFLGCFFPFI